MKIEGIGAHTAPSLIQKTPLAESSNQPSFADFLTDKLTQTNDELIAADTALQHLATGDAQSLHQTMLTLEQAKLSFQLVEQVRNRLMSAYQDILREQI